jgi:hypothetical protein
MIANDPVYGKALANFPSNRERPLFISGALCFAAALVLNFTFAAVPDWWGPTLTMLLMALLVLACGWYLIGIWNREVVLYERGFSYREGSRTVYFYYAEIRALRQQARRMAYFGGLLRRAEFRVTLRTDRDETIVLDNTYKGIDRLAVQLETQLNAVLRPVIQHLLKEGKPAAFGEALALTADGVQVSGNLLAWGEFAGCKVQGGRLALLRRAPDGGDTEFAGVSLEDVDNLTLLLEFLRRDPARRFAER